MRLLFLSIVFCFSAYAMEEESSFGESRIVLIGAGRKQAQEYFALLKDDVSFVAFVQPNPRKDLCIKSLQENIPVFSDLESVDVSFDGAIVAVPDYEDHSYTQELIKAHKFVIKEKSFAIMVDQTSKCQQVADQKKLPRIYTIVERRFHPSFINGIQDLSHLGKIYSFKYEYTLGLSGDMTGWRSTKSLSGGGALLDMGYHIVDVLMTFFGMPEKVSAECSYKGIRTDESTEDEIFVLLSYSDNMVGSLTISRYGFKNKEVFEIFGNHGSIKISPQKYAFCNEQGVMSTVYNLLSEKDVLKKMFMHYFNHINDSDYNAQELARHMHNVQFIEKIYQAARGL